MYMYIYTRIAMDEKQMIKKNNITQRNGLRIMFLNVIKKIMITETITRTKLYMVTITMIMNWKNKIKNIVKIIEIFIKLFWKITIKESILWYEKKKRRKEIWITMIEKNKYLEIMKKWLIIHYYDWIQIGFKTTIMIKIILVIIMVKKTKKMWNNFLSIFL